MKHQKVEKQCNGLHNNAVTNSVHCNSASSALVMTSFVGHYLVLNFLVLSWAVSIDLNVLVLPACGHS